MTFRHLAPAQRLATVPFGRWTFENIFERKWIPEEKARTTAAKKGRNPGPGLPIVPRPSFTDPRRTANAIRSRKRLLLFSGSLNPLLLDVSEFLEDFDKDGCNVIDLFLHRLAVAINDPCSHRLHSRDKSGILAGFVDDVP